MNKQFPVYNSRIAEKFVLRFPDGMRDRIAGLAKDNHRSMNSEIIRRLEATMPKGDEVEAPDLVEAEVHPVTEDEMALLAHFRKLSGRQKTALVQLIAPSLQEQLRAKAS